jgi:hypothetical protein
MRVKPELNNRPSDNNNNADNTPEPDWLTFKQAAFYFTPLYTGREADWLESIKLSAANYFMWLEIDGGPVFKWEAVPHRYPETFVARVGDLELLVDPQLDTLLLQAAGPENAPVFEGARSLLASLQDFTTQYEKLTVKPAFASAAEALSGLASELKREFKQLNAAIQYGEAALMARVGSPLNPFTRIYPDQWRYFTLLEEEDDIAEGPHGERLYCLYIVPIHKKTVRKRAGTKARSQTECTQWLKGLMEASPNCPTAKEDLRTRAMHRWSDLSARSFERAWGTAIDVTKAEAWSRPGPRPKSAH